MSNWHMDIDMEIEDDNTPGSSTGNQAIAFNPSSAEVGEDLDKIMRGDAIGNTLYSERFVFRTLLKLSKLEEYTKNSPMYEALDKDLCTLWDMTIEPDVANVLLDNMVLDIFAQSMQRTEDQRIIEVLVGIMSNMCNIPKVRVELCNNPVVMTTILRLITCGDTLILIQLMRLLYTMTSHVQRNTLKAMFEYFVKIPSFMQDFCLMLCNSTNKELLSQGLKALNAMLNKFSALPNVIQKSTEDDKMLKDFIEVFVKQSVVESCVEAYKSAVPEKNRKHEFRYPTTSDQKIVQTFLNIHFILTRYQEHSNLCYHAHKWAVIDCFNRILRPMCDINYLLPLTGYDFEVAHKINDIYMKFGDPFQEELMFRIITVWALVAFEVERRACSPLSDEFDESDDSNFTEFNLLMIEFLKRIALNATEEQLQSVLRRHDESIIVQFVDAINAIEFGSTENCVMEKIKTAYRNIDVHREIIW